MSIEFVVFMVLWSIIGIVFMMSFRHINDLSETKAFFILLFSGPIVWTIVFISAIKIMFGGK